MPIKNDRLYINPFNSSNDLATGKGGIRVYNKYLGLFLKCFGFATTIKEEGEIYYVNKKSYAAWKNRHPDYKAPQPPQPIRVPPKPPTPKETELTIEQFNKITITDEMAMLPAFPYARTLMVITLPGQEAESLTPEKINDAKDLADLQKLMFIGSAFLTDSKQIPNNPALTIHLIAQGKDGIIGFSERSLNPDTNTCGKFPPEVKRETLQKYLMQKTGSTEERTQQLINDGGFTFVVQSPSAENKQES